MATLTFHGPHDSNECRKAARALAKELGGKFSYTSFYNGKRGLWFSADTVGKAAYSVRCIPIPTDGRGADGEWPTGEEFQVIRKQQRKEIAAIVRTKVRGRKLPEGMRYTHGY